MGQVFFYFNGDEITTRNLWKKDQVPAVIQSFGDRKLIILDEAQMGEEVGIICKQIIDAELGIQLILTDSSALNMAHLAQEPLTGRKWEYILYPISCAEIIEYSSAPELLRGLSQYLVDILALTGVKKSLLLEEILKALAWQVGSEFLVYKLGANSGNIRNEINRRRRSIFMTTVSGIP